VGGFDRTGRSFRAACIPYVTSAGSRGVDCVFANSVSLMHRSYFDQFNHFLSLLLLRLCIRNLCQATLAPTVSHSVTVEPVTNEFVSAGWVPIRLHYAKP
jgi:hypothetical protein